MEMLQVDWKQHLRPRAVVGYGVKIFLPSPPNYVTRSPGKRGNTFFSRSVRSVSKSIVCLSSFSVFRVKHRWIFPLFKECLLRSKLLAYCFWGHLEEFPRLNHWQK